MLKPFDIRQASERDRRTCMWRHHVEADTFLKYCVQLRRTVDANQELPLYNTPLEVIKDTLCEPVSDDGLDSEIWLEKAMSLVEVLHVRSKS